MHVGKARGGKLFDSLLSYFGDCNVHIRLRLVRAKERQIRPCRDKTLLIIKRKTCPKKKRKKSIYAVCFFSVHERNI